METEQFPSKIEAAIVSSTNPIQVDANEREVSVLGQRGLWLNRREEESWKADIGNCYSKN